MPTVTFNLTTTQAQRVQEAADYYNQRNGTTLTAKQFAWLMLRQGLRNWLAYKGREAIEAASSTAAALIDADLEGEV